MMVWCVHLINLKFLFCSPGDDLNDSEDEHLPPNKSPDNGSLVKIDENKIDTLWQEFCKEIPKKTITADESTTKKTTVDKEYDFAGETVVVREEVATAKVNKKKEEVKGQEVEQANTSSGRIPIKRTSGGLSSLLGQLKKPKMTTLTKSLHDWNDYKRKQNLEEELSQHLRSRNSYLERQAFLSRADLAEFENEKSIREHERRFRKK